MDLGLAGKCYVATGASRGIGAEIARALARERANVTLIAHGVRLEFRDTSSHKIARRIAGAGRHHRDSRQSSLTGSSDRFDMAFEAWAEHFGMAVDAFRRQYEQGLPAAAHRNYSGNRSPCRFHGFGFFGVRQGQCAAS